MASTVHQLNQIAYVQAAVQTSRHQAIFNQNRDRVYSLSFYMTDNEMAAEDLMTRVFCRAFAASDVPSPEMIDRALVTELREHMSIGELTLACTPKDEVMVARRNVRRDLLERAVVSLPATERMVFLLHDVESCDHTKISRLLSIREEDSRAALMNARLRIRELLAESR